jgi:peptidyl-prolyl cis-trans isomerase C
MNRCKTFLAACALIAPIMLAGAAAAQDAGADTDADTVIARINGYEIRTSEVKLAAEEILSQLSNLPANARYPFVVQYLIERHLLAQAGAQANVAETDVFKERLTYFRAKALRDAYFLTVLQPTVTEEEARAAYDREAASVGQDEQVHARHILVEDQATALGLIDQLKGGAKFEDLAREHSQDPGAADGGDLGFFTREEMVKEFSDAAFALQPGEVSGPVQTQFGWHIIKVEDRRTPVAQAFDDIKDGLMQLLARQKVQEAVQELQRQSNIEILDPDLQALVVTEDGEEQQQDAE